jgi:hypothetical protein
MHLAALAIAIVVGAQAPEKDRLVLIEKQGAASVWADVTAGEPPSVALTGKLTLVLRVVDAAPLEVEITEAPISQDGWLLEAMGKPSTFAENGGATTRWEQVYRATPLKPGANPLRFPGLKWTAKDGPEQSATFKPLLFGVTTRITRVDISELRDRISIEEPPERPVAPRLWWPWLFAAIPALAVIAFAVIRLKRHRPVAIPPHAAALQAIAELERELASDLLSLAAWQARLAEVLRQYLEQRFGWPATRRTTAEFLADSTLPLANEHAALLAEVLRLCDLAKFSGRASALPEATQAAALARLVVEQTSPPPIR